MAKHFIHNLKLQKYTVKDFAYKGDEAEYALGKPEKHVQFIKGGAAVITNQLFFKNVSWSGLYAHVRGLTKELRALPADTKSHDSQ